MTKNILKQEILKCNILQKEYKILSNIICNLENIIIQNETILLFSKNQVMKLLNELIKKLNESYNDSIINILSNEININSVQNESMYSNIPDLKSENKSEDSDNEKEDSITEVSSESKEILINNNILKTEKPIKKNIIKDNLRLTINDLHNLELIEQLKNIYIEMEMNIYYGKYNELFELTKYDPFREIKKQIIMLGKIVGFTSISDIIYLNLNITNYNFKETEKQQIELLTNVFIPLDFNISIIYDPIELKIKKINSTYVTLFNNQCEVDLCIGNNLFKIIGYIKNDPLNIYIRTSQISNIFLYNKKNNFEKIINSIDLKSNEENLISKDNLNKLQKINKDFADVYLKNLTITEILILSNDEFVDKIYDDYLQFNELNKIQFVKLIKNFTKDASENLYNMFNTIRLLLLGTDENCTLASLLFNLIKDKKVFNGNEFISNIIYQQLNYISQLKIKKSTFNIKNELDKLKGITSSDIDLKKQVLLSKNMPENVKKICLEKIEELKNSNNETYKIKMYVNLLIQFPWLSEADDNVFKIVSSDKNRSKLFLENIETKLNENIYGHNSAKNKILQILAKLISVQGTHISPISLTGPPGVGKTKFAQCLAECLDIPFVQITLGGQNDGELLHGHGYTYAGAQPGLIVKKMVDASGV